MKKNDEQIRSEIAEIIQTLHYEGMEVTNREKELLYKVKSGAITEDEFNSEIDQQVQKIIEESRKD